MKQLIFLISTFIVIVSFPSCTREKIGVTDKVDNNNCSLKIELLGGTRDDRTIISFNHMKELKDTLTILKCFNDFTDSCSTNKIELSKSERDEFYSYVKEAINNFELTDKERAIESETIRLSLFTETNSITVSYNGFKNPKDINSNITKIINLLNEKSNGNSLINW